MAKPKSEAVNPDKDNDWEADNALDTISKAEEHKQNPDMMARIKKRAGRKIKALSGLKAIFGDEEGEPEKIRSIDDLRKVRNKMAMKKA